jgi:hypothetical protein
MNNNKKNDTNDLTDSRLVTSIKMTMNNNDRIKNKNKLTHCLLHTAHKKVHVNHHLERTYQNDSLDLFHYGTTSIMYNV